MLPLLCLSLNGFGQSNPGVHSARAHALAGVGVTLQGIDALYFNAAGLTSLERTTLHGGSAQSFGLIPLRQVNAAAAIRTGKHNMLFIHMGQFGFNAYQERQVGVGYAMQFTDNLSGALSFDVNQFSIEEYGSAMLPGFGFGIQYRLGSTFSFGVAARNPVEMSTHDAITLPTVLSVGMAYHLTHDSSVYAEIEKDVDFTPRIKLAAEYRIIEALALRIGAASNPGTFHAGVGIKIRENLAIDIAAGYHTLLGFTPALGITFEAK